MKLWPTAIRLCAVFRRKREPADETLPHGDPALQELAKRCVASYISPRIDELSRMRMRKALEELSRIRYALELIAAHQDLSRIRSALAVIPPDNHLTLMLIGKAMTTYGEEGFAVWNEWVQPADKRVRDLLCREAGLQ